MARAELPIASRVAVEPIATLAPNYSTLLVATSKATYALQPGQTSGVLELADGKAVPTPLNSAAVAASMSLPKARGQITSIAADGDRIAFCFAGMTGSKPVAAVGVFNPATGEIFTTVDTFSLERVDPEIVTSTIRPFLCVNGDTAWLIRVEKSALKIITIRKLRSLQPDVSGQQIDLSSIQDTLTRSAWEVSAAELPGKFYLTDTASRWIRTFDDSGQMKHVARFDEQVDSISPATFDASGRVVVLMNGPDSVNSELLIENGSAFKALPTTSFEASGRNVGQIRMDRLVPIPGRANQFLAYDATSGTVLRVALR